MNNNTDKCRDTALKRYILYYIIQREISIFDYEQQPSGVLLLRLLLQHTFIKYIYICVVYVYNLYKHCTHSVEIQEYKKKKHEPTPKTISARVCVFIYIHRMKI